MHAEAKFGDSGSKLGKIAIVTGLHLVVALGLLSMKVTVTPKIIEHGPYFPLPTPVPQPEPLPEPDFSTKSKLPEIVVPLTDRVEVTPDTIVARKEVAKEDAPHDIIDDFGKEKLGDTRGKANDGPATADAKGKVFTAALANAKDCVLPEYPKSALRNGDTGTVNLALLIGTNGEVTDSRVQQSSGFRDLDRAAVAALRMCKFKPATTNGVAQPAWGQIAYVWRID